MRLKLNDLEKEIKNRFPYMPNEKVNELDRKLKNTAKEISEKEIKANLEGLVRKYVDSGVSDETRKENIDRTVGEIADCYLENESKNLLIEGWFVLFSLLLSWLFMFLEALNVDTGDVFKCVVYSLTGILWCRVSNSKKCMNKERLKCLNAIGRYTPSFIFIMTALFYATKVGWKFFFDGVVHIYRLFVKTLSPLTIVLILEILFQMAAVWYFCKEFCCSGKEKDSVG